MEPHWTEAQDAFLSRAVILHRFDFTKVAADLNVTEEAARVRWTLLYCQQQGLEPPPIQQPPPAPPAPALQESLSKPNEQPPSSQRAAKFDVLDISDVDFSQQTSVSITGEIITPSSFNIFDHSLKETCDQIRMRAMQCLPKMDFVLNEDDAYEEVSKFRSRLEDNQLLFERFDESIGEWVKSQPNIELPSMDDIKLIPDDYDPLHPTGKYAAAVKDLTHAQVWKTPEVEAPVYKEVIYKGTKTLVKVDGSSESDEEDLEALKRARQRMRGRVMKEAEITPIVLEEAEDTPTQRSIDLDKDSQMTPAYRNIIQKHEESQKEATKLIKELQDKWQQEKDERLKLKALARKEKEEAKKNEELQLQEAETQRLQAEREKRLAVKLEEAKRKQQKARIQEEEAAKAMSQSQHRQFENHVISRSEFNLFDKQASFAPKLPGIVEMVDSATIQVIAAEVCEEAMEVLWYFCQCSEMFGEIEDELNRFKLVGVLMTSSNSITEHLALGQTLDSVPTLCLGLYSLSGNSRPLKSYLAGFPLSAIVGRAVPGKFYLSDLFTIVESFSVDEARHPATELFTSSLSMLPVGLQEPNFNFATVIIKPLLSVEDTIQMVRDLIELAQEGGLDLVGLRTFALTEELKDSVQAVLTYTIPPGLSLALCFYGPKPSTVIVDAMGPESLTNARKFKPDSLHCKYGSPCGYASINSAKAHRDTCLIFGGRFASSTEIPCLHTPSSQTCTVVLSPKFGIPEGLEFFEWLLKSNMQIRNFVRCELSSEAEALLTKRPRETVEALGVRTEIKACLIVQVSRPNIAVHLQPIRTILEQTSRNFTILSQSDEEQFLAVADSSPFSCALESPSDFPTLAYILLTPEAFRFIHGQMLAFNFVSILMKRVEVVGLKMLNRAVLAAGFLVHAEGTTDLSEWIASGLNLLIAIRGVDAETELDKALLACKMQNNGSSQFTKPTFVKSANCSSFSLQELASDPLSQKCPFSVCQQMSVKFNDFFPNATESVAIVKPERNSNMLKQLLRGLAKRDFEIIFAEGKQLSHQQIDLLYANSQEAAKLAGSEVDFEMYKPKMSGSSVVFKVRRVNAVQKLLELAGDADPVKASSNSLRGAFGDTIEDNGLHCSASLAHAEIEAKLLCKTEEYGQLNPEDFDASTETVCCFGALTTAQLSIFIEAMFQEGYKLLNIRIDTFVPFQLLIYAEINQKEPSWIESMTNETCVALGFRCPQSNQVSRILTQLGLQSVLNVSKSHGESLQEHSIFFNELLLK